MRRSRDHRIIAPAQMFSLLAGIGGFLFLILPNSILAQTNDTLSLSRNDSLFHADSLIVKQDTLKKKSSGIDSLVAYTANDSIVFSFNNKVMTMYGKGDIRYKVISLNAEQIQMNWTDNQLEASGVLDSVKAGMTDSLKARYRGTPVMMDGGEKYNGWKIYYNFKSQKGRVTLGETSEDKGFYYGEQIKKVDQNMLFIANGRYTTCENSHPHYYFFSPEMRVTMQDKIVARPIYLYVSDVPIFVLPFGVFPSQGGRRSGIIGPAYGDDGRRGRYISHLGYYEAISDYMDFSVAGDWYSSGAWRIYPNFRYAKRYDFSGSISADYARDISGEAIDYNRVDEEYYRVNLRHNQEFNPSTRMDVDFTFASNNSFRTTTYYQDYLRQEIYSNATLSKFWEGTNSSMSVNISRRQDLREGNVDATLPSISYSHAQTYPFRSTKKSRGLTSSGTDYAWYEMIGMNYNSQLLNRESKSKNSSTNDFDLYERRGVSHTIGINAAPKAGYFTIGPFLSYQERWYDKSTRIVGLDTLGNPVKVDKSGFEAVRFFSMGLSASTKLYGIFQPPIPGLGGFRHTVTPSLTYSYQPDFSKPLFGYYGTYIDKNGNTVSYDRFQKEVFGGAPAGESQAISLSVGNLFEMKTLATDTLSKEQKYQLLNVNGSISYNFAATEFNLSPLTLSYRTDVGRYLGISGSSTYNFYTFDPALGRRVNKYLINSSGKIADMTSFSVSLTTSLSGEKKRRDTPAQTADSIRLEDQRRNNQQSGYRGIYEEEIPDFSIPWNLSLGFNFSQYQDNPSIKTRSANLSANLGFNLTENWKFSASGNYDVIQNRFAAPSINIYRDLHCWEMNFNWTPLGALSGYRFEIKVKAPQLQDVKVTKQSTASGFY